MSFTTNKTTAAAASTATASASAATAVAIPMTLIVRQKNKNELTDELISILNKFEGWKDECSFRIFAWGIKVLKLGTAAVNEEAFYEIINKKLSNLFKNILANPLKPNLTLKKPMLDRNKWVWEEQDLKQHFLLTNISPFDPTPVQIDAKPHELAIAVIDWVKLLPAKMWTSYVEADNKEELSLISEVDAKSSSAMMDSKKIDAFLTTVVIAQEAITAMKARQKRRNARNMLVAMKEYGEKLGEQNRASEEATKKILAQSEKTVKEQISRLEQTHRGTVQILDSQITAVKNSLNQAVAENQNLKATSSSQAQQIQQLNANQIQLMEKVIALEAKVKKHSKYTIKI